MGVFIGIVLLAIGGIAIKYGVDAIILGLTFLAVAIGLKKD